MKNIFLFDKIFNNILLEENLPNINTNIIYKDLSLGIIPLKIQIPNKVYWDLIMQYCNLPIDKLIVIISNVSKDKTMSRKLSKTNLTKFSNILKQIEDKPSLDITEIKTVILNKINNLSYKDLLYYCNQKLIPLLKDYEEIKDKLIKYLNDLKNILFKNINTLITPQKMKQILTIYASTYNITNRIQIKISQQQSPFNDMINIITKNCNNCEIYINTALQKNNKLVDDLYKLMNINKLKNMIIPHKIFINNYYKDFQKKSNNFDRQNFPDKLSSEQFSKVIELLKK